MLVVQKTVNLYGSSYSFYIYCFINLTWLIIYFADFIIRFYSSNNRKANVIRTDAQTAETLHLKLKKSFTKHSERLIAFYSGSHLFRKICLAGLDITTWESSGLLTLCVVCLPKQTNQFNCLGILPHCKNEWEWKHHL